MTIKLKEKARKKNAHSSNTLIAKTFETFNPALFSTKLSRNANNLIRGHSYNT